jgi:hypothetical protein
MFAVVLIAVAAATGIGFVVDRWRRAKEAGVKMTRNTSAKRPGDPTVSVVIPALNEERSVDWVVDNLPEWVDEVILVDGLSTDGTELVVADRLADVVIVHQRTKGKGAALRAGFAAATSDIIVMIDADGSTDPREMGRFVDALKDGADFVKGSRNLAGGGSVDFTRLRHYGNLGFVIAANALFGSKFTDLCYGYCAFWRDQLDDLRLTADGFDIEMELVLNAVKADLEIAEVPSIELERRAGLSNLNAWADGWRVLRTLLRQRVSSPGADRIADARIGLIRQAVAAHDSGAWQPAGLIDHRPAAISGIVEDIPEAMDVLVAVDYRTLAEFGADVRVFVRSLGLALA